MANKIEACKSCKYNIPKTREGLEGFAMALSKQRRVDALSGE